ncbi:hypothetical protein D7V80_27370 [Corallococcus sp. CA054B]|uniref:hypothetical protein n=1 Tax=Corallococcus sp. CA054B TaxID=2316734 RepID=UPI000EA3CE45|nr:hypothetical protein [Corallococcus sp. CA054B]RKG64326.1 hypothetical protein D7V80_27370 [Corallococcus sp. CA054B]
MVPPPSPQSSLFDFIRTQAILHEEAHRIRDLLFEQLLPSAAPGASESFPAGSQEEVLLGLLRRLQVLMLKHPIVVQAAFCALVAEGRRFAATPEGAAWKSTLASSPLLQQGRRLWDALSLNIPEEDPATVLPSAYIEALFQATGSARLEELLRQLQDLPRQGEAHAAAR